MRGSKAAQVIGKNCRRPVGNRHSKTAAGCPAVLKNAHRNNAGA